MNAYRELISTILLTVWVGVSVTFFISMLQSVWNDHRREERERERDKRELEYHRTRMKSLK